MNPWGLTWYFRLGDTVQNEAFPAIKQPDIRTTPGFVGPFVPEGWCRQRADHQNRYDAGIHPGWLSQVQIQLS